LLHELAADPKKRSAQETLWTAFEDNHESLASSGLSLFV
jgi:hypothetical protein